MLISNHITYNEATRTATGLENKPNAEQLSNMVRIAENVFEPLRSTLGRAIIITSFFRSASVNAAVGGASTSQHCKGEAMDLKVQGRNKSIFEIIRNQLDFDQLIWEHGSDIEPAWVHVSYKKTGNRKQVLRAAKVNGRTKYNEI